MKIAIFGSGGVGGYFGARLQQAGEEVAFVARGPHLAAMKETGLIIESPLGDAHLLVRASDDPAELGPTDVVLVATKTYQLDDVVEAIGPLLHEETLIVPLLNGVEAADRLEAGVDRGAVAGGLCRIVAYIATPGTIRHVGVEPSVTFGLRGGRQDERVERLAEAFRRAEVTVETPSDIDEATWRKFLFVVGWGAIGAASRAPLGVLLRHGGTRELLRRALEEIRDVAAARGIELGGDAPDKAIAAYERFPAEATTSLQRDLADGRPSELDDWSGAVARLGRQAGVDTPVHTFVTASLTPLDRRARGEIHFD